MPQRDRIMLDVVGFFVCNIGIYPDRQSLAMFNREVDDALDISEQIEI